MWIYFEFRHTRLSALILVYTYDVQEMFLRLSFGYFNKLSFMNCSVDLSTLSHIETACSILVNPIQTGGGLFEPPLRQNLDNSYTERAMTFKFSDFS